MGHVCTARISHCYTVTHRRIATNNNLMVALSGSCHPGNTNTGLAFQKFAVELGTYWGRDVSPKANAKVTRVK